MPTVDQNGIVTDLHETPRATPRGAVFSRRKPGVTALCLLVAVFLMPVASAGESGVPAKTKREFQYRYPFDTRIPVIVGQGPNEELSHHGRYAFDFGLPIRREVWAARRGVVERVVDGYSSRCAPVTGSCSGNAVVVKHRDGSSALYLHLSLGVPVAVGDRIRPRQMIGYSGNTGPSTAPHLHFEVFRPDADGAPRSIPIRFRDGSAAGNEPVRKDWILQRPAPNVALSVLKEGRALAPDEVVPVKLGDVFRLRVQRNDSPRNDVTRDSRTRFYSPTPWLVDVSSIGRVQIRRDPSYQGVLATVEFASITVVHEDEQKGEIGFVDLRFTLPDFGLDAASE